MAFASFLVAMIALVNLSLGLYGCATRSTDLDLITYIYDITCDAGNETIVAGAASTGLHRRPFFGFLINWFQACFDDLPVVIFLIVVDAVIAADSLAIFIYVYRLREATVAAKAAKPRPPPTDTRRTLLGGDLVLDPL